MIEDSEAGLDRYLEEIRAHSRILDNEDELITSARTGAPPKMARLAAVQEANLVLLRLIEKGTEKPSVQLGPAIKKHFAGFS